MSLVFSIAAAIVLAVVIILLIMGILVAITHSFEQQRQLDHARGFDAWVRRTSTGKSSHAAEQVEKSEDESDEFFPEVDADTFGKHDLAHRQILADGGVEDHVLAWRSALSQGQKANPVTPVEVVEVLTKNGNIKFATHEYSYIDTEDHKEADSISCTGCAWTGPAKNATKLSFEYFFVLACPKCQLRLLMVGHDYVAKTK